MTDPERPPVEPEDCGERHHDKDGFPLPCHVCGRNGGTVVDERPPVDRKGLHPDGTPCYADTAREGWCVCERPPVDPLREAARGALAVIDWILADEDSEPGDADWLDAADALRAALDETTR